MERLSSLLMCPLDPFTVVFKQHIV